LKCLRQVLGFSIEIEIHLLTFRWSFTNYTNYTIKKFFSEWLYYNLWQKVSWKLMAFVWWCTFKIIGMLVHFFLLHGYFRRKKTYIYIYMYIYWFSNLYEYIYIRLIIYSYFYLFKYSTNKHHRKLCIYTHRIWN
jgi:hypothetical protein